MAHQEAQPTGSGKEIALLVGVLLLVAAATIGTYWIRSRAVEALRGLVAHRSRRPSAGVASATTS